ncbi:MAG: cytochrome c maturation protein CcmE [Bacteroidia bacterium]|nr:cytochrome c maturation protein CcmE [Bacteroidia bacterium]
MKFTHIIALLIIAAGSAVIFSTLSDAGTYDVFNTAFENPGDEYHVIGTWSSDKELIYEPARDPNLTVFYMRDTAGVEKKIFLHKEKPTDFERSDKLVIIGKAEGDAFHAKEILMKCPSKYNNTRPEDQPANP